MAVFDARQGQVLPQPVSNYYQGKALRAGIEAQEIANEQAPEKLRLQQERVEIDKEVLNQRRDEFKREAGEQNYKRLTLHANEVVDTIDSAYQGTRKTPEEAQALLTESLPLFADYAAAVAEVSPERGEEIAAMLDDHVITPEEYRVFREGVKMAASEFTEDKRTTYQRQIDGLVDSGAITPDEGNELMKKILEKAATITGTTEFDPGANDPRTGSQKGAAHQANLEQYNESSNLQEMIGSALPRVSELPGAVGFSGKAAIGVAGIASTLGYEEVAEAASQYFAGASPEEVSAVMAQLQAVRGQLIPIVTGQESRARLSDKEQELGDRAVSLINQIEGPADLAKAYPQVVGALRQFYEESWAKKYRLAEQDDAIDWPYDLNNRKEFEEFIEETVTAGLDDASIRRMTTRLRMIQGINSE